MIKGSRDVSREQGSFFNLKNNKNFSDCLTEKEFEDLILYAYCLGCAKIIKILIKLFKNGGFND